MSSLASKPSVASKVAAIVGGDGTPTQALLSDAVATWRAAGVKVGGVIAETHGIPDRTCGAGLLRDIATGQPYKIYFLTAPSNTSCHLDPSGVEAAGDGLLEQLKDSDVIVLSKFGKLEAMHQGLASVFDAAVAAGKPVLTTVSEKQRDAWRTYAPDAATLPPDAHALQAWWQSVQGR
jgi:nucleoside-triphosphatase THEP1